MIVNSSVPPMRQSASSGAMPTNTKSSSEDRAPQTQKRDFDSMVKNGNLPFSSGGTAAQNETATALFIVKTAHQAYTIETAIGDSAVSFDARAIVGPVSEASGGAPEVPASIADSDSGFEQQAAPYITNHPPASQAGIITSAATHHPPAKMAALRSNASMANHAPRAPLPDIQNPLPVSRESVSPSKTAMVESRSTPRASARASLPPPPAARGANFAALVAALPQEVRVTVRGMMLEQSEREELSREIRTALASHGFGHRSIHIISGEGTT